MDLCGATGLLERLSQMSQELRTGIAYLQASLVSWSTEQRELASLLDYVSHKIELLRMYARFALERFAASAVRLSETSVRELATHVASLPRFGSATTAAEGDQRLANEIDDKLRSCREALECRDRSETDEEGCRRFVGLVLQWFVDAQATVDRIFARCSTHVGKLLTEDFRD